MYRQDSRSIGVDSIASKQSGRACLLEAPRHLVVSGSIERSTQYPSANGEFSDVWECVWTLRKDSKPLKVAVKVPRGITFDEEVRMKFIKAMSGLVELWKSLKHLYTLDCYGLTEDCGLLPGFVSPYCKEGNILQYLNRKGIVTRYRVLSMLCQITEAVAYIHSQSVIHADIRAANIMVDDNGVPQLTDIGLTPIISRTDFTTASIGGPCRWMAPEILLCEDENGPTYNQASDVYALGMTILEVMTRKVPYSHIRHDSAVIFAIIRSDKPRRPDEEAGISENLWRCLETCWDAEADHRPSANTLASWLRTILNSDEFSSFSNTEHQQSRL